MSGNRGCVANSCLFLVIIFLPVIGQVVATLMIIDDHHGLVASIVWLVVIWLIPVVGPLLYLFFGQRSSRYGQVMFGQPSYPQQQQTM